MPVHRPTGGIYSGSYPVQMTAAQERVRVADRGIGLGEAGLRRTSTIFVEGAWKITCFEVEHLNAEESGERMKYVVLVELTDPALLFGEYPNNYYHVINEA